MAFVLPGGVNDPAVTAAAVTMVVSGSDCAPRRSHDAAGVCATGRSSNPDVRISSTLNSGRAKLSHRIPTLLLESVRQQSTAEGHHGDSRGRRTAPAGTRRPIDAVSEHVL